MPEKASKNWIQLMNAIPPDCPGFDRNDVLVALGVGVGDLTGFAAATYLRWYPFYPASNSLLAMVDSSIGAKPSGL
jgi:3-dehydroquinate synthetase